jgi:2-(1,2-epoxy-1,2-dihydrophenyl)acetyl-CoA isomerase
LRVLIPSEVLEFMRYDNFHHEIVSGVATVSLIGPGQPRLADLCDEFLDLMLRLQEDAAARVILITDGDHAFDLHHNLDTLVEERRGGAGFEIMSADMEAARRIVTVIQEINKPVITATQGAIRNMGLGLFMAGDVRLASSTATFTPPDLSSGLLPDWGLTFNLPRLIGPGRTLEILWSRRTLDADEAGAIGLVDRVIDDTVWEETLLDYLERLASLPQPAVHLVKLATQQAAQFDLTSMLSYEFEGQLRCWESHETSEGLAAHNEGRRPSFDYAAAEEEE